MFVRNRTPYRAVLARGSISDSLAVATVVIEAWYRVDGEGGLVLDFDRAPSPSDPPSTSGHVLWNEVSVTVSGTVYGPKQAPNVTPVMLSVGRERRRLIVFGDRRWEKTLGGSLEPSDAAPFDSIPLSFERAFGGKYTEPPGPHPVSGLPHPGGEVFYSLNPNGRGFYKNAASAEGSPLPNIELPDELIKEWDQRPEPAGFSPCPTLMALRFPSEYLTRVLGLTPGRPPPELTLDDMGPHAARLSLRGLHYAPGKLIFSSVMTGTPVELTGAGRQKIQFNVVGPPVNVVTASGDRSGSATGPPLRAELRSIHIDADGGHVLFVHGYSTSYHPDFAPEWLRVLPNSAPAEP